MIRKFILLSTLSNRLDMLKTCIPSIKKYSPGWHLVVVAQEFNDQQMVELKSLIKSDYTIISKDSKLGMHTAKVIGLEWIKAYSEIPYVVCSVDDDMEFLEETDLRTPVEWLFENKSIGLLSLGWVNHRSKLEKQKRKNELVEQIIVYTGGGLLFRDDVADLIIELGKKDLWCDNTEWSLAAYLKGYTNYRWRGSITIHHVCSTGGRRSWAVIQDRILPDSKYVNVREGSPRFKEPNNYLIPTDKDVTKYTKQIHERNRR